MDWWQAILLGLVQGLTEFLPVSSSGHLMIFRNLLGVDGEGFLDFTVTVHFATVLSTIFVFRKEILSLLRGFFKFKYNDETDYVLKIFVSMIPIGIVGVFFKDSVEALFGDSLTVVACCLLATSVLLLLSDVITGLPFVKQINEKNYRNGISYWQAFLVGLAQSFAVAPGLSRSGCTISSGLICGVKRPVMAQFSFLMVLAPILGEQMLDLLDVVQGEVVISQGVGAVSLMLGFLAAFASGLFACRVMVALVRRAKMKWFALYCLAAALCVLLIV